MPRFQGWRRGHSRSRSCLPEAPPCLPVTRVAAQQPSSRDFLRERLCAGRARPLLAALFGRLMRFALGGQGHGGPFTAFFTDTLFNLYITSAPTTYRAFLKSPTTRNVDEKMHILPRATPTADTARHDARVETPPPARPGRGPRAATGWKPGMYGGDDRGVGVGE